MKQKYDLSGLAEAVCLDKEKLSESFAEDLQELHRMLQDAVQTEEESGGEETLFPPGYGVSVCPACDAEALKNYPTEENAWSESTPGILRQDQIKSGASMLHLSSRRDGKYVSVPQVEQQ